jgi:2-phospho-L-lactate guanylyltransferase
VPGDCPALDAGEVEQLLDAPATGPAVTIVPDRHGTGTNALMLNPPDLFLPAFGPDSCARHVSRARATGQSFALEVLECLAIDLDTPEDFTLLRDRLLLDPQPAPRTAKVLWQLGDRATPAAA